MPEAYVTEVDPPYEATEPGGNARASWRYTVDGPGVPEKLFTFDSQFFGLQTGASYEFAWNADKYGNAKLTRAILVTQVNADVQAEMPVQETPHNFTQLDPPMPEVKAPTVPTPPLAAPQGPPPVSQPAGPALQLGPPPGQIFDRKQETITYLAIYKCVSLSVPPGTTEYMAAFEQRVGEKRALLDKLLDQAERQARVF